MFGKSLRTTLVLVMLLGLVIACGGEEATSTPAPAAEEEAQPTEAPMVEEGPEVLRVWITWGDDPAQIQELFNRYGDANNVTVEVNSPVEDDKVIAALSGSEPPDVLVLGGPDSVSTWVNEGLLAPLDDLIAANNIDTGDIYPAMLAQGYFQGKYYALPWGSDTYALFWNKDLFEEAGLDPEKPPETMEELLEYADMLTKQEADGTITQLGFVPDFSWSHLDQYAAAFGGYFVNEDGTEVLLTSDPVVNALKWEQQFYSNYGADEVLRFVSSTGEYDSAEHGFMSGKIAMMVDGEWMTGDNFIGLFAPELWYGVAPIPYPEGQPERAGTNLVQGTVVVIPSGVKSLEASGKLLAWMMSPEIVAEEMVANFNLPSSREAAKDPRFLENEKFAKFMELANSPNATSAVFTAISGEILTELDLIEQQVLHTGADPEPLLQEAQGKLQEMLDKALGQ
jgi:multiple sugar transport system substrate-binding protein